jgi:hypothetical protein
MIKKKKKQSRTNSTHHDPPYAYWHISATELEVSLFLRPIAE